MKRFYFPIVIFCLFTFGFINNSFTQIQINDTVTPEQMVENFVGNGIVFENVNYTGADIASGVFTNGNTTNLGFESGIFLTSGWSYYIPGPNGPGSCSAGTNNGMPGDALLASMIGTNTYDASVLQFDFIPSGDTIRFKYVFGSEEYNEYVNSTFNDVFGTFLSGPNPDGGIYTNKNISTVPGSYPEIPTAINNVNNGWAGCDIVPTGPCTNCEYYVDNTFGASLEYDGLTVVLTAWSLVIPNEVYHLKIAIADAGDGIFDSGIFLEENSLASPSSTSINAFSFDAVNNPGLENDVFGNFFNDSISLEVPFGSDISNLIASFSLSPGAEAFVNDEPQQSGITSNDFTNPVTYTIVSEDKSEKDWFVTVGITTGIAKRKVDKIQIYPNPAKDILIIDCIVDGQVTLSNPEGRILNHYSWEKGLHQIDISALPEGIYYLEFRTAENVFSRKIIIAR